MTHRRRVLLMVPLVLVIVLLHGCVKVLEPLSNPGKAEPDKGLVGKWKMTSASGNLSRLTLDKGYEIGRPAVEDNPKGLMRAMYDGQADDPTFWFFTTKIGKDTYATLFIDADFSKAGAFEKWNEKDERRYHVFRYVLDGDKLTIDGGDDEAMEKLMQDDSIPRRYGFFDIPEAWLAKYLEKNGPKTLYNRKNVQEWRRLKK